MIDAAPRDRATSARTSRISYDAVVSTHGRDPFPLLLQRRARVTLRRHFLRGIVRIGVLGGADVATLLSLRLTLHAVREGGLLGSHVAQVSARIIPHGTFPTVQFLVAVCFGLALKSAYGAGDRRRDPAAILGGVSIGLGLIFWTRMWQGAGPEALLGFSVATVTIGVALLLERLCVDAVAKKLRPASEDAPRTLIIGTPDVIYAARAHPALADPASFTIVATFNAYTAVDEASDLTERLVTVIVHSAVDTVVLCGHYEIGVFRDLVEVADAAGCHVYSLPRVSELAGVEPQLVWRRGAPLVQLTRPGLRGQHLFVKRALDIALSSIALIGLVPLLLAIAITVKLTSRGPVLFKQRRVGRGGRLFWILKFRSMVANAEERRAAVFAKSVYSDERLFKIVDDPRVTRLGAFLRRSSLDELPQLWNVLKGEMSLVGPRPPLPSEVQLYAERHYARFHMKPGITGPWQVGGRNQITDFEKVIRLETEYMWQWSLWRDLGILIRTIPAVIQRKGAC